MDWLKAIAILFKWTWKIFRAIPKGIIHVDGEMSKTTNAFIEAEAKVFREEELKKSKMRLEALEKGASSVNVEPDPAPVHESLPSCINVPRKSGFTPTPSYAAKKDNNGVYGVVPSHTSVELTINCPVCGNRMVRRKARYGHYTGRDFYGCSTYPYCKGIVNIN